MSILTVGTSVKKDASTSRRPFFERSKNTHSARSSISHPQLRDLLICPAKAHHVQTVYGHGIDAHVFGQCTMRLMDTPTTFSPNCLVTGCGYVAMGGETADLLIRSADVNSRWELKIFTGQSIVNSVCFYQASSSGNPQVLICNNDQTITQYDLSSVSSIQNAALDSLSADSAHRPTPLGTRRRNYVSGDRDSAVASAGAGDEKPLLTHKDSIILPVPVNHCSVSPDSRAMVAVGDSNEVFLYDCQSAHGTNEPLVSDWRACARKITLPGVSPSTGSFSTSWSQHGDKFAVASEGEVVVVYDMKMLGKPLLVKHTSQNGHSGAARVVKFSPEGPNELLAFTEHQSLVHVLDARTFDPDHEETLTVPTPLPGSFPPRLSPGSIRSDGTDRRRVNLRNDSHPASSFGLTHFRRISRLNAQLNGTSHSRASREIDVEDEEQEEEEEAEREEATTDRAAGLESGSSMDFLPQSGNSRIIERLWGEMQDGEEGREPSSSLERIYLRRVGARANGGRGGFSWSVRSMLGGSAEDEACLDGEGESSEERRAGASARATLGSRPGWERVTTSGRETQLRGSSIRLLAADNERAAHPAIQHRSGTSSSVAGIHSQLISHRLGRPPTFQSESWFDLGSTAGSTGTGGQQNIYGGSIALRSGMGDDLIGLSWSPDGEWLVCGTEAGLVEWKVKRSSRTGFGDVRLC